MDRREFRRGMAAGAHEQRFVSRAQVRAVTGGEGEPSRFVGHAVVYEEWTRIYDPWFGDFMERIARGAFAASIQEHDIRFLVNHDPNLVLARRRGDPQDTLTLREDELGVLVEADIDRRLSYGNDLAVSLERGDVTGMSFGFSDVEDEWDVRPDGMWARTVTRGRLWDVSAVTYPAYEASDAGLRSVLRVPSRDAIRELVATRTGRRNSSADEAVIRAAAEECRAIAEDLDGLLEERTSGGEEDARGVEALLAGEERRHRLLAAKFGLSPA